MTEAKNWPPSSRPLRSTLQFKNYIIFLIPGVWIRHSILVINSQEQQGICYLFLNSLKHIPHLPPHTSIFSFLDLIIMWDFSKMDLLWREGRGKKDRRAERVESSEAQQLPRALFPELHRVLGKQKWHETQANSQFEQVPANFCIYCTEWVVQEVDVCILIHGSRRHRHVSGTRMRHAPYIPSLNHDGIQQLRSCSFQEPME